MAAILEICKLDARATFYFGGENRIRKIQVLTMFPHIVEFRFRWGARGPFLAARLVGYLVFIIVYLCRAPARQQRPLIKRGIFVKLMLLFLLTMHAYNLI